MKQIIWLLLLALFSFSIYSIGYDIYYKKHYKSEYSSLKVRKGVDISPIKFDKKKIENLNDKIKKLRQDPTYKLQLSNIKGKGKEPLFIDNYSKIYDKILLQNRLSNNYE